MSSIASKERLLAMLNVMTQPKRHGLDEATLGLALINFCAACPDPIRARWLVVECLDPMTDEELVRRALDMPVVPMADVPASIVPVEHPARTVTNQTRSLQ